MRKLSKINEGLWKDGVDRAKTQNTRLENRIDSNVYDLKPIDFGLPFLVASSLLTIGDENRIVFGDYIEGEERKEIERQGWRLPKMSELKLLLKKTKQTHSKDIPGRVVYRIQNDKGEIVFALSETEQYTFRLFTEDTNPKYHKADVIYLSPSVHSGDELRSGEEQIAKFLSAYVLLVRDKVNEGLWKSGVERATTGNKRKEDITDFERYVEKIEWVDMGDSDYLYAKFDYDEMFSMEELSQLKLPKDISIATLDEINIVRLNSTLYLSGTEEYLVCQSDDGKTIYFNKPTNMTSSMYATSVTEESKHLMRMSPFIISSNIPYMKHAGAMNVLLDCNAGRRKALFIKLIKLK